VWPVSVPPPLAVLFTKPGGAGPSGSCHGQFPPSGGRKVGMSVWLLKTFMRLRIIRSAFGLPAMCASRKPCTVHEVV